MSSISNSAGCDTFAGRIDRIILDQDAFSRALCLERKRADRSHRLFMLMLLDLTRLIAHDRADKALATVLKDLSLSIRDTDILGWHSHYTVLGILFTEISRENRHSILSTILSRVNGALYGCLTFEQFNRISISHHLFPEEWSHDVPHRPSQPLLYPDLLISSPKRKSFYSMKRLLDIIGSLLGLLFGMPLFLMIALAIKSSSKGPVLFRQVRVGQYGVPFIFLKFRSMRTDSSCHIHREYVSALIRGSALCKPVPGGREGIYKVTKDPRITRVGVLLRKTSLDELPQLYNVLLGQMSLVGPRPAIPYEVEAYESWHRRRVLEAKPGITGLWQVKGRSRVTFDEMVRLDVRYATAQSLWLDIKILLQTPCAVILGTGAY